MNFASYVVAQIDTGKQDFHNAVALMSYYFTDADDPMSHPDYRQASWDARTACQDVEFWTNVSQSL